MAAVASRNPMRTHGTNGSRANTPSSTQLNRAQPSPSLFPFATNADGKQSYTPSRLTRASSDPPPDNLKRNNSTQFELEPNPFEQSFSGSGYSKNTSDTRSTASQLQADAQVKPRRARSQSPVGTPNPATQSGNTSTASGSALRSSTGYSRLPPLSALTSPATEALQASFWGMDNNHSLRSGPLSPAMLQGPSATSSATNMPSSQAFDPNTFRTGLTPSGSMANPPGPATAALFALMTNATPGGQPPNQFEMNFAKHMDQQPHDARPRISEQFSKDSSDSMNSMHSGTQASGPASSVPSQQYQAPMAHGQMPTVAPHLSGLPAHMQQHAPGGHNPLYLFSQATANDFPGGSEDDLLAVNALRNLNSPQLPGAPHTMQNNHSFAQAVEGLPVTAPSSMLTGHASRPQASTLPQQPATYSGGLPGHPGMTMAPQGLNSAPSVPTRKRKTASSEASQDPEPETNARGTRKRAAASKRVKAEEGLSEDEHSPVSATRRDSLVPLEDMPTVRPLTKEEKKCMSEEDKRKNFLERNRQAALKCRQRKKAWLTELQDKVDLLQSENSTLSGTVAALKGEISTLRSILVQHKDCPVAANNGLSDDVMTTLSQVMDEQPQQTRA